MYRYSYFVGTKSVPRVMSCPLERKLLKELICSKIKSLFLS